MNLCKERKAVRKGVNEGKINSREGVAGLGKNM